MMKPEIVQVERREYERLRRSEEKLLALEAGGVDNWDGYDWAMEALGEDDQ
ncbi:hypothetical protein [Tardibacter chloracetimidivorans]|uniref:hypothetical protein n=1 Tax=Tardibacter chloracetimidivorans TaxID=1921510 RepID=UPI00130115A3|nr:hypothetical protein [Tardibacter chloracetimidivorans]